VADVLRPELRGSLSRLEPFIDWNKLGARCVE